MAQMADHPHLDRPSLAAAFRALDARLGAPVTLIVGGGTAMLLAHGIQVRTRDVDAYTAKGHLDDIAPLLREVAAITPEILALAQGSSPRGRGGMATTLESARLCMEAGVAVVIAQGEAGIIPSVVAGQAECTLFLPGPRPGGDPLEPWLAELGL